MLTEETILSILPPDAKNFFVAYSGGVDSHVLLHLISSMEELKPKITAVYINHGLQKEGEQWEVHCEKIALDLGVRFQCINVNAQKVVGKSHEEIARDARYSALKTVLELHDVLFVAQHREDQMETVLLQLFRGAGIRGLSGMPLTTVFGAGIMLRPFLDCSKQDVIFYAEDNKLQWIEDPSNQSSKFDRNFLRNQIIPQIKQRWIALDKTISRSARHCATSDRVIQDIAKELLDDVLDAGDQTLRITSLLELDMYKQQLVIRQWFGYMKLRMPSETKLDKILNEVVMAKATSNPEIHGKGYCIRRYRDKVYCLNQRVKGKKISGSIVWSTELRQLEFTSGLSLTKIESSKGISKALWDKSEVSVKFRKGAEKIRLPRRIGHHTLKKLFQEKAIPPWERENIPLIYLNNQLAAVSDLWISADFYIEGLDGECYRLYEVENN